MLLFSQPLDKPCLGRAAHAGVPDELLALGAAVALVVPPAEAVEAGPVAPQEPEAVLALVVTAGSGLQAPPAQEESPRGAGEATAHGVILDISHRKNISEKVGFCGYQIILILWFLIPASIQFQWR